MQLRPYQEDARRAGWDFIRHAEGNPALVLPTGAGKSPLMAAMARDAVETWQGRVGVLAHVQELVEQNAAKLRACWRGAPMGIYAAGLGRRDRLDPLLYLQIQSVAKRARELGAFDVLFVDEAHRIPFDGDGQYLRFIEDARTLNPALRVIGLTATPYRLKGAAVPVCGPGRVLTEIAYEARIPDLIRDGFLSRLVSRAPDAPDLEGVHTRGGEYVETELAACMEDPELVRRTCADLVSRTEGRRAGIVFCVRLKHAEMVLSHLPGAALVHAGTPKSERAEIIAAFQRGELRWLVNINVLSEGFDAPHVDVVAMLRPTKSPGLYYQQVGRGLRLAPGKTDCLVLDYAGNIDAHGPVDEIRVQRARPGREAAVVTAMVKTCPCGVKLALSVRLCPECGHEFGADRLAHDAAPSGAAVISTERERVITTHAVTGVDYKRHEKVGKPASLCVVYSCGLRRFKEWICLEHGGFALSKAAQWWRARAGGYDVPGSVNAALELAFSLPRPTTITVDETAKFPQVIGYEFAPATPTAAVVLRGTAEGAPEWLRQAIGGAR